jgi:uncharacterized protein
MASSPQHEPTMEEILASIRKIISEDSSEAQAIPPAEEKAAPAPLMAEPAPAPVPAPVSAAPADADVLDLTEEVAEPAPSENDIVFRTVEEPPPPEPAVMAAPAPRLAPQPEPVPVAPVAAVAMPEPPAPEPEETPADTGIFSDRTRRAMDDAFASIEEAIPEEPVHEPAAPLPAGGEQLLGAVILDAVRQKVDPAVGKWLGDNAPAIVEHMKPLIREWMDEHFPALLEGAVRNEVARVVKARGAKR